MKTCIKCSLSYVLSIPTVDKPINKLQLYANDIHISNIYQICLVLVVIVIKQNFSSQKNF